MRLSIRPLVLITLVVLFFSGSLIGLYIAGALDFSLLLKKDPVVNENTPLEPEQMRPVPKYTVTLNAVGDIMLARHVGRLLETNGQDYSLKLLGPSLAEGDITFANLESPIAESGQPLPGKQICFRAKPDAIESLKLGGFDVVSLANNHALDYDSPALLETIERLTESGIKVIGAGADITRARQPAIIQQNGIRIAFLAYSDLADIYFSHKYPRAHRATKDLPGVAPMVLNDILEDVRAVRQQVDLVVVSLHWGVEYVDQPSKAQREMAHRLIDEGVDLILGHHPHWLQGLEVYHDKLIAYSLGNFIFDQNWSESTREGLVLQAELDHNGVQKARVRPVFINQSQPQWATDNRQEKLMNQVVNLCQKLNTTVKVEGDWVTIELKSANGSNQHHLK